MSAAMQMRVVMQTLALFALAGQGAAIAQVFKCTDADGRTVFADRPCANGAQVSSKANSVGESSDRPEHIRAAIAEKRPAVGMRRAELLRALGPPLRQIVSQVGTSTIETLTFRLPNVRYAVTLSNGEVSSVSAEDAPGLTTAPRPAGGSAAGSLGGCGSPTRSRELEAEIRKAEARNNRALQSDLQRLLRYERECR